MYRIFIVRGYKIFGVLFVETKECNGENLGMILNDLNNQYEYHNLEDGYLIGHTNSITEQEKKYCGNICNRECNGIKYYYSIETWSRS